MLGKRATSSIKNSDKPKKDRKPVTLETKLDVLAIEQQQAAEAGRSRERHPTTQLYLTHGWLHDFESGTQKIVDNDSNHESLKFKHANHNAITAYKQLY